MNQSRQKEAGECCSKNYLISFSILNIFYLKIKSVNILFLITSALSWIFSTGMLIIGRILYLYLEVCGFLILVLIGFAIVASIITEIIENYK